MTPHDFEEVVPQEIKLEAFAKWSAVLYAFPEDEWYSLSPEWDLNLWLDGDGVAHATVYPVVGGNTISSEPYPIL